MRYLRILSICIIQLFLSAVAFAQTQVTGHVADVRGEDLSLIHIYLIIYNLLFSKHRHKSVFSRRIPLLPVRNRVQPVSYTHLDVYKRQIQVLTQGLGLQVQRQVSLMHMNLGLFQMIRQL